MGPAVALDGVEHFLMKAGFSIEEIVRCATFNGAQLLEIKDLGLLVPGNTEYRTRNFECRSIEVLCAIFLES